MAEDPAQLPVYMNQEYRVKLGRSFILPKDNAFHTIKYDFKPKSVDFSKPGRMKVEGDEVAVSLPVVQAESADDVTLFRGSKRPCAKECILIINTQSGEAVLEKISNMVQLKAIRDGNPRSKKIRSVSPLPMQSKPSGGKPLISAAHTSIKPLTGGTASPGKVAKMTKAKRKTKDSLGVTPSKSLVGTAGVRPSNPIVTSLQPMSVLPESISPIHSNNPTPEPPPVILQNPDQANAPPTSKGMRSGSSSSNKSSLSASSTSSSDSDSENMLQLSGHGTSNPSSVPQLATASYPYQIPGHMTQEANHVAPTPNHMISHVTHPRSLSEDSSSSSESESSDESSSSSGSSSSERALARPPATAGKTVLHHRPSMSQLRDDLEMSDSDESGSS